MRTIEYLMLDAVREKRDWKSGNTRVEYLCALDEPLHARLEMSKVYLHGNPIACYLHDSREYVANIVTLAQWPTATTKSRLRAMGINVQTKHGITYLNGRSIR